MAAGFVARRARDAGLPESSIRSSDALAAMKRQFFAGLSRAGVADERTVDVFSADAVSLKALLASLSHGEVRAYAMWASEPEVISTTWAEFSTSIQHLWSPSSDDVAVLLQDETFVSISHEEVLTYGPLPHGSEVTFDAFDASIQRHTPTPGQ